jgi:polysaccharide biosynthesis protein PslG
MKRWVTLSSGQKSKHRRWTVACVAAILVSFLATSSAVAPAAVSPGFFGVTPAPQLPTNQDLQRMGRARVGTVRFMLNWAEVQPSRGGPYNFSELDRVVARSAQQGITALPYFYGTPVWARNCSRVPAFYCDRVSPLASRQGRRGWVNFLAAVVARYGTRGTLWFNPRTCVPVVEICVTEASPPYRPITRWQIWSEPNSPKFFRPKVSPKKYRALLKVSVKTIRRADPGAKIVLGGLFGTPPKPGMSMRKYLDGLYRLKGVKRLFDEVALHPYARNIKGIKAQLKQGRRVMRQHRDAKTPVALTEIGWGSATSTKGLFKGIAGQASLLTNSFNFILKNRKRFKISGVEWFSWRDIVAGGAGFCTLCESFGLLNADYSAKPSLSAFVGFTGGQP